jgi:Ni,Fe-hydrogenase III large subunit
MVQETLAQLPPGPVQVPLDALRPNTLAVAMVEGWRGEIAHVAVTDASGDFARYKIVDPSFRNWSGLAMALRGEQISDFPLCNKSFNLSYCGFDL